MRDGQNLPERRTQLEVASTFKQSSSGHLAT